MSRRALVIAGSVGGLILLTVGTAFAVAASRSELVVAGVTVEGVDVGGLDAPAARDALQPLVEARSSQGVSFVHEGTMYEIDPVEAGVAVDVDGLVAAALEAGRTGAFFGDRAAALFGTEANVPLVIALDEDAVASRVQEIATSVNTELFTGAVTIDAVTLDVTPELPVPGVTVDEDEAVAMALTALATDGVEELVLPVDVVEPDTDDADVESLVEVARAAVSDDMSLSTSEGTVKLSPREIAALLVSEPVGAGDQATLRLVVTPTVVEEQLLEILKPLTVTAVDARYDAPAVPSTRFDPKEDATWRPKAATVTVIPGRDGTSLDTESVAEQLTKAVASGVREVAVRVDVSPPAFSTEKAKAANLDTMLSTFTTYHACCATRVENIQRLADLVDRTVVLPGEQFSINQISGVRACSKGFKAAGMIMNGEIVDSCGGGVSQFGTTTVNAVFFAGLKPDAYKPHSFYISRYPAAREATLNYPSPDIDVRFTNDTGNPILVRTSHTSTSVTVTFYGNSNVTEVRADLGSRRNIKPFPVVRRVNNDLPAGAELRVQGGQDGFYVPLTRTVLRGAAKTTDDWSNTYVPETEIYEYNPAKPKPVAPKPTEPAASEPAASEPAAPPTEPVDG